MAGHGLGAEDGGRGIEGVGGGGEKLTCGYFKLLLAGEV